MENVNNPKINHNFGANSKLLLAYDIVTGVYSVFVSFKTKYVRVVVTEGELKKHFNIDVNNENYLEKCVLIKDESNSKVDWTKRILDYDKMPITTKLLKRKLLNISNGDENHIVYINVTSLRIPNKSLAGTKKDLIVNVVNGKDDSNIREIKNAIIYQQERDKLIRGYSQLNLFNTSIWAGHSSKLKITTSPNSSLTLIHGIIATTDQNVNLTLVEGLFLDFSLVDFDINCINFIIDNISLMTSRVTGCPDINTYYIKSNDKSQMTIRESAVMIRPYNDEQDRYSDNELDDLVDLLDNVSSRENYYIYSMSNRILVTNTKVDLISKKDKSNKYLFKKNLDLSSVWRRDKCDVIMSNTNNLPDLFKDEMFNYRVPGLNLEKSIDRITYFDVICINNKDKGNNIWKAYIKDTSIPLEDMLINDKLKGVDDNLIEYGNNLIASFLKLLKDNSNFKYKV